MTNTLSTAVLCAGAISCLFAEIIKQKVLTLIFLYWCHCYRAEPWTAMCIRERLGTKCPLQLNLTSALLPAGCGSVRMGRPVGEGLPAFSLRARTLPGPRAPLWRVRVASASQTTASTALPQPLLLGNQGEAICLDWGGFGRSRRGRWGLAGHENATDAAIGRHLEWLRETRKKKTSTKSQ